MQRINSLVHIERTPGVCEGAQLNFEDALCNKIQEHVSNKDVHKVQNTFAINRTHLQNPRY